MPEKDRVAFIGDTHGALDVTEKVFRELYDKVDVLIFLGDYVDRGLQGIENLKLILRKMLENPEKVIVLRGNHESPLTNEFYGFKGEVLEKMGDYYEDFVNMFSVMPYAATINGYFCVHGGIARNLEDIKQIVKSDADDPYYVYGYSLNIEQMKSFGCLDMVKPGFSYFFGSSAGHER
ncbi:MAG: metallophosphoesterase, partial [Acidianus infernus]|nr:metallophosphoesterase [Acidianus infernus]